MARENLQTVTGNHIKVLMDGKVIGLMQNCSISSSYGNEPVSGIGEIDAIEHPPSQSRHEIRASFVALRRSLIAANAGLPRNGAEALKGLIFDIEIYDKRDGVLLNKAVGCTYTSGETTIEKHRVVSRNASFMALTVTGDM